VFVPVVLGIAIIPLAIWLLAGGVGMWNQALLAAVTVLAVGSQSRKNNPVTLADCGVELFYQEGFDVPLVQGCGAYLICRLLPEPHNQQAYDLFIGEVEAAWADDAVFRDGHWRFDEAGDDWRTLHYVSGGQFYAIGRGLDLGER